MVNTTGKTAYTLAAMVAGVAISGCVPSLQVSPSDEQQQQPPAHDQPGGEHVGTGESDTEQRRAPAEPTPSQAEPPQPAPQPHESSTGSGQTASEAEYTPAPCTSRDVTAIFEAGEYPDRGEGDGYLTVTKTGGSASCAINGYPSLQMVRDGASSVPTYAAYDQQPGPSPVVLKPGEHAGFRLRWWTTPYQGSNQGCVQQPTSLSVGLPGGDWINQVPVNMNSSNPLNPCQDGTLHVSAFKGDRT